MTKIVYASLTTKTARSEARAKTSSLKTITAPDGTKVKMSSVDAGSPTFGQDLTAAFRRNVARVRRENKRLIERADHLASDS